MGRHCAAVTVSRGLALLSLVWVLALPLAADMRATAPERNAWALTVSRGVYALGHFVCHQRRERSFSWAQVPWPVCARCTGIYVGVAVGLAVAMSARRWRRSVARRSLTPAQVRAALAIAALPIAVSLTWEWTTGQTPSHLVRAATGLVAGVIVALLIDAFLHEASKPSAFGPVRA